MTVEAASLDNRWVLRKMCMNETTDKRNKGRLALDVEVFFRPARAVKEGVSLTR